MYGLQHSIIAMISDVRNDMETVFDGALYHIRGLDIEYGYMYDIVDDALKTAENIAGRSWDALIELIHEYGELEKEIQVLERTAPAEAEALTEEEEDPFAQYEF